jgi:hypothetical protein
MNTHFSLTKRLNQSRRPVDYSIGDELMVSTRNLQLPIGSSHVKKFTSRFMGPNTVTDIVANGLEYKLKLPPHKDCHPTFHVGSLKPFYHDSRFNRDAASPQLDIFEDGLEEWGAEVIVDHRPANRGREPKSCLQEELHRCQARAPT